MSMLEKINLERVLVLDIETIPQYENYSDLPERWKALWDKKAAIIAKNDESPEEVYPRAGIYAEFGKIVCISVGMFIQNGGEYTFRIKSYYGHDEVEFLNDFLNMLNSSFNQPNQALCAHNGKEFDFPYLCRRALINGLSLPHILDLAGKKPWEVQHLDTMNLWKFGDFKSYTSLDLMAACFDIPTPKDDIDGSQVRSVYYEDKDLERIKQYCEKDIITLANILLKMKNLPLLEKFQLIYA